MYTIAAQIREAYSYMKNGKFDNFARTLYATLYFMAIQCMISYQNLRKIVKTLHLKDDGLYMETNPDGTSTIYKNNKMIDTFLPDDVFMWLLKQLVEDEVIVNNGLISNIREFNKRIRDIFLPDRWQEVCEEIDEQTIYPLHANGHFYYLQKSPWGSHVMKKVKCKMGYTPKFDEAVTIIEGIESEIVYAPKQHSLYGKIKGMDAYVQYNVKSEERQIVYQAELVGVSSDGTEWYRDRKNVLCSFSQGTLKHHKDVLPSSCLYVCKDGIEVLPTVFNGNTHLPYRLNSKGEREECSHREVREWLWNRMLHSLILYSGTEGSKDNFTQTIQQEEVFKVPFPFTRENVLNKIKELPNVNNDEKHKMVKLLDGYENEDVVDVFYRYWNTSQLVPRRNREMLDGKIGSFTEEDGKLLTDFDSVLNGQIQENRIDRCNVQRYEGEVYYDLEIQEYVLVWNGEREFKWKEELELLVGSTVLFAESFEMSEEEDEMADEDEYFHSEEIQKLLNKIEEGDFPF